MEGNPLLPARQPVKGYKIKKLLTYFIIALFFLSGGIEYSVILPTCWDFMRIRFDSEKWLYGLTLSAMSMSNLFIGPVMGGIYDRTHQTKAIVTVLLLFQIGGNFMYFAATSQYMVLGSRFIVGVGISAGAVLFGELARTTTTRERTGVLSLFMSTRQIGLVIGPAFNLFLRVCHFSIGPFVVDKYTAPALFMMIVFLVIAVLFLCLFFHLPSATDLPKLNQQRLPGLSPVHSPLGPSGVEVVVEVHSDSDHLSVTSDKSSLLSPTTCTDGVTKPPLDDDSIKGDSLDFPKHSYGSVNSPSREEQEEDVNKASSGLLSSNPSKIIWSFSLLLREDIVMVLAMILFSMTGQMILETGFVPFAENLFGWRELETSIFYSAAGAEVIVAFLISTILSRRLSDRWLIFSGLIMELVGYIWYVATLGSGKKSDWIIEQFVVGTFFALFGLPFFVVGASSLFSKLIPPEIQGFGQGVRRSIVSVAAIIGPLWAGAAFELSDEYHYYPFFGVSLVLMVVILILLPFSFSKLKEPNSSNQKSTKFIQ